MSRQKNGLSAKTKSPSIKKEKIKWKIFEFTLFGVNSYMEVN